MSPQTHQYFFARLWLLVFLLAIIAIVAVISTNAIQYSSNQNTPATKPETLGEKIRTGALPPPPFSTTTAQKLAQHHSFQALVSYTDQGFEPKDVTIKAGQTVRFTDNSSGKLWVGATSTSGVIYPPDNTTLCGESSLDSCLPPVAPQDFWEVTLTHRGDWSYGNLVDGNMTGVVHVK
jgi:plastocyanin